MEREDVEEKERFLVCLFHSS